MFLFSIYLKDNLPSRTWIIGIVKIYRNIVLGESTNETVTQPKSQNLKPKKDLFRPYCLKDPDIKPFKLQCNYKVRFIHNVEHTIT